MAKKTEKAIADALKKLLAKKPLKKITISDIAEECGINRMTFYYHYRDVYDLIEHICDDSLKGALAENRTLADWQVGIRTLMEELRKEKAFYTGLFQSIERDKVTDYMYDLISELLQEGMTQVSKNAAITPDERQFIVDFYTYAFVGLLLQWVREGMKEEPALLVERMAKIGQGGLGRGLDAFSAH